MYICILKFRYGVPCVEMLQKRAPDSPKLELYSVVRLLMWMKVATQEEQQALLLLTNKSSLQPQDYTQISTMISSFFLNKYSGIQN